MMSHEGAVVPNDPITVIVALGGRVLWGCTVAARARWPGRALASTPFDPLACAYSS
jgi:hypothetical protein